MLASCLGQNCVQIEQFTGPADAIEDVLGDHPDPPWDELLPTVDTGEDSVAFEGDLVILDGAGSSDPYGEPLSFLWEQLSGPPAELHDRTSSICYIIAPEVDADVTLTFALTVTHGDRSASATTNVEVLNLMDVAGIDLTADAGDDLEVTEGETVTLDGSHSTGERALLFSWTQIFGPLVTLSADDRTIVTFVAPYLATQDPDTLVFELTVTDGSEVASDMVSITVHKDAMEPLPPPGGGGAPPDDSCPDPDADADGDGVADCNDGCPNDPDKTEPGTCGCGTADIDSDGNGTPDCNETVELLETFDGYSDGADPSDWLDTSANNSMTENDSLFKVFDLGGEKVFGTSSTAANIHSHYVGTGSATWSSYVYTGRLMITQPDGGIGMTFRSDYPNTDRYYRLRRYDSGSFHISPHGTSVAGTTDTGVVPAANTWYHFRIEVEDAGVQTAIRGRVWAEGGEEPAHWQVDCYDKNAGRLTAGTVGIWSMGSGNKYWDDLSVSDVVQALPPSTCLVRNEEELLGAAAGTVRGDLNILVDRVITVNNGVRFPKSESIVRLIGVTPQAAIRFNMVFDGNWERPEPIGVNGLEFNCRQAIIRGLQFTGYETLGSAIKGHTTELLDISACYFHDIGTMQFPHKVDPPETSYDTLYNQCIGAHNMANGHISVVDCSFERCVLNNRNWSHCLYISARSVLVTGNRFIECGNVFQVGSDLPGASNNIFGNEVIRPQAVLDREGVMRQTYIGDLRPKDFTAFMFNKLDGAFYIPWIGHPRAARHLVDFNDYQGMTYIWIWACDYGQGTYFSWDTWRTIGFDNHSSPPEKQ